MPDFNGQRLANIGDPIYNKDAISLRYFNNQFSGLNASDFVQYTGSTQNVYLSGQSLSTSQLFILAPSTPSGSTDYGTMGEIRWDSNYLYVAISANTWTRTSLSGW